MSDLPIITTMLEQVSWVPADPLIHVLHLTLEPGAAGTPPHKHPGPMIGYVLEGELDFQMAGHDPVTIKAGEAFCVPVFFVAIGLAADLRSVPPVLPFALALLAVAIVGKVVGSGLGAALGGLERRSASLVGIGMIARGEVALVAATLGLRAGAIDSRLFSAVVLVALATTIATPVALSLWARRPSLPPWSDIADGVAAPLVATPRFDVE